MHREALSVEDMRPGIEILLYFSPGLPEILVHSQQYEVGIWGGQLSVFVRVRDRFAPVSGSNHLRSCSPVGCPPILIERYLLPLRHCSILK
jgi:hypothetical protein